MRQAVERAMRAVVALVMLPGLAHADPIDIAATVEAAVAKVPAKPPVGVATLVAELGKTDDVGKTVKLARERLVADGYTVVQDGNGGELVILDAKNGARVSIAVDAARGRIAMTAKPSTTKAPGACLAIPSVTHDVYVTGGAVNQDGEFHEGTTHWVLTTTPLLDVDGDGIPDVLVPQPTDKHECPEDMMWKVYVVRGTCGHELGVIGPGSPVEGEAVPLDTSGFRSIAMSSETSRFGASHLPELTTTTTSFAVTKGHYVQTKKDRHTGVCHHCAVWHCHGA